MYLAGSLNEPLTLFHRFTSKVSTPSLDTLEDLSLLPSILINRGDHNARAAEAATKGGEKYMSSSDMYRHLNLMQELVPVRHTFHA